MLQHSMQRAPTEARTCDLQSLKLSAILNQPALQGLASTKPSTLPVTSSWPSGENAAHSAWLLAPNLTTLSRSVGNASTCGVFLVREWGGVGGSSRD